MKLSVIFDKAYEYNLAEYYFLKGNSSEGATLLKKLLNLETYSDLFIITPLLKYALRDHVLEDMVYEQYKRSYEARKEKRSLDNEVFYARLLAREERFEEALAMTTELLQQARKQKIKSKIVEVGLFRLRILQLTKGELREQKNLFREALYYAGQEDFLLPFYYEKDCMVECKKQAELYANAELSKAERIFLEQVWAFQAEHCILSEREREVLFELAEGYPNKEIAEHLCISLATVKSHIINIYGKLEVKNRISALEVARREGLI